MKNCCLPWQTLSISGSAEKEEHTKQSLDKAKEAVALDVKDGTSWSEVEGVMCVHVL